MTACFAYPKSAAFGRVVAKHKTSDHASASASLKELFVRQVDQINWRYKLAPETINLAATKSVKEVQVFGVSLKTGELDHAILRAIDKAIPVPLLFEIGHRGRRKMIAAFKRPTASGTPQVSAYFESGWEAEDAPRQPLPTALNLGGLYEKLIGSLIPLRAEEQEDVQTRVERTEAINAKQGEIERIRARLQREKQFNKRLAINAELRVAKKQLEELDRPSGAAGNEA